MTGPTSNVDEASTASGGPLQTMPSSYSPSTFAPLPAATRSTGTRDQSRYTRGARTPVPELAVAVVVVAATIVLVRRALETVATGGTGGPGPTWWQAAIALTIGDQALGIRGADGGRVWLASAGLLLSLLTVCALARRIGVNGRLTMFGGGVVAAALPAWWILPLIRPVGRVPDRTEVMVRLVVALCVLLGQAIFARWVFTARGWRAAGLPGSLGHLFLWVPLLVANLWILGPLLWTLVARGDDGFGKSSWELTDAIVRFEGWVTRGTGVLFAVFLVVATVSQHAALARERSNPSI